MSEHQSLLHQDIDKMNPDDKVDSVVVEGGKGDFEVNYNKTNIPLPMLTHGLWTKSQYGQEFKLHQWRILDGNFNFPFNGEWIRGPKVPWKFMIVMVHFACCLGLFFAFEMKQLLDEGYTITSSLIILGSLIIYILMVYHGYLVIFTDPGYIERPNWEDRMDNFVVYLVDKIPGVEFTKCKLINMNGKPELCRFCVDCCNYRPPKSEHCEVSDSCIERYDHFSNLFGTSIGLRNIGYYMKFLFVANFLFYIIQAVASRIFYNNLCEYGLKYALVYASPTTCVLISFALYPPFALITFGTEFLKQILCFSLDQTRHERKKDKSLTIMDLLFKNISTKWKNLKTNVWNLVMKMPPQSKIDPKKIIIAKVIPRQSKKIGEPEQIRSFQLPIEPNSETEPNLSEVKYQMSDPVITMPGRKKLNRLTLSTNLEITQPTYPLQNGRRRHNPQELLIRSSGGFRYGYGPHY